VRDAGVAAEGRGRDGRLAPIDHAGEIAAALSELGEGQFAIFEAPDGSFVQVVWSDTPGVLRCEAVDFDLWDSARAMTDAMRSGLEGLGFEWTDSNYALEAPVGDTAAIHRLAGLLARALHEVYGMRAVDPLRVTVDDFGGTWSEAAVDPG
jgi:hypothetical protein